MFKERYRKANDSILVNQELLEKLKEKAAEPKKKRRFHATRWASAVVAAVVLGIILISFADLQQFRPKTAAPIASPSQKTEQDSVKIAPSPQETADKIGTKNESNKTGEQAVQTPVAEKNINGLERADSEINHSVEESVTPEKSAEKDTYEARSGDNNIFSIRTADGDSVKGAEDEFSSQDALIEKENDQQAALATASDVSFTEPVPNDFEAEVNPGNFNGNSGQGSSGEALVGGEMHESESTCGEANEKKDDELTDCEESSPPDCVPSPLAPLVPWEIKE